MERTKPEFPGAKAKNKEYPITPDVVLNFKAIMARSDPVTFGLGFDVPLSDDLMNNHGIQSMLATAIYPKGDKPYMCGLHQCSSPRVWTPQEKKLFQEICRRITDGLTGILAYRDLENRVQERTGELKQSNEQLIAQIAERTRAENMLSLRSQELARSNMELERFAYVASHDLQEPLRMVISYLQLLEKRYKGKLDVNADEFIEYAVDGAKRMRELITGLLTLSRIGTKAQPYERTDCESILKKAVTNLQEALKESNASVVHDHLPFVWADPTQLIQLFQNLIGNAIKFRKDTNPQIIIRAELQDQQWLFSFQDNGIGIEPEYFQRIFLIFQRLHGRNEYPGTGIGLAICQRIVERHGGVIWVESEPGKGATFKFTLPQKGNESS